VDAGVSNYLAKTSGMPGGIGSQYFGIVTALLVKFAWGAAPAISPLAFAVKRIYTRLGGTAVQWYYEKAEISEGVRGAKMFGNGSWPLSQTIQTILARATTTLAGIKMQAALAMRLSDTSWRRT